ncbi:hypothetical protein BGX38DRAFT_1154757, partial [Terfezia claveryi]
YNSTELRFTQQSKYKPKYTMDLHPPGRLRSLILLILVICFLFGLFRAADAAKDPGKIRLTKLNRLTLRNGQMTTGRRESPIPQVGCLVSSATHMGCGTIVRIKTSKLTHCVQ